MAKKTTQQPKAKKAPAAAKNRKLRAPAVETLIGMNERELLKNAEFKKLFEAKKKEIFASYEKIIGPQFARTISDAKTGLQVLISAVPVGPSAIRKNIRRGPSIVIIQTMVGNIHYTETVEHVNLKRACEFIGDYSQVQTARFCEEAVNRHAKNEFHKAIYDLTSQLSINSTKAIAYPVIDKNKALKAPDHTHKKG